MNSEQKENQKLAFQALKTLLSESNAPQDLQIVKESTYQYRINQKTKEYSETRTLTASRKLKAGESEFLTKFNENKKKFLETLADDQKSKYSALESFDFEIGYNKGDQLQTITGLEKLNFEGDKVPTEATFASTQGVVTLVDFWATWCGPCQGPMGHNEEMLSKHEEDWKDKVSIVGLSVDDETEVVVKRVEDKNWKRVNHYRFKAGWDGENDAMKLFQIDGIPFVALINKFGKIHYMGHPSECKLEEEIEKLINENEPEPDQQQLGAGEAAHSEQAPELVKAFKDARLLLRGPWKETAEKTETYKGHYNASLTKKCNFKIDGTKCCSDKSRLTIAFRIHFTQKEQVEALNQLISTTVPAEYVNFTEQTFDDPESDQKNHLQFIYDVAAKYNLPLELDEEESTTITYNFQSKQFTKSTDSAITQSKNFSPELATNQKEIRKELGDYFTKNREKNVEKFSQILRGGFNFSVGVGSKYVTIGNTHKFGNTDETLTIEHKEGQVLIVDFWAFWCGPCIGGMIKNSKLFKDNKEKWGENVRFVAISLEGQSETKELLDKKPEWLESLEFQFMKDGRENPAPTVYGVRYIPHLVVVGKDGIIRSLGHCDKLEAEIEKLIAEEGGYQGSNNEAAPQVSAEQGEQLCELVNNENFTKTAQEELQKIEGQVYLKFKLSVTKKYLLTTTGKTFKSLEKPTLNYWVRENQQNVVQDAFSKLFAIIPKDQLKVDETISKLVDIPFPGKECELCKVELNDQTPQYYNHFNTKFYCVACAEADDKEKVGNGRYKIIDTLVFINAPLKNLNVLKEIDDYKFGKNLKINEGEEGSQQHPMSCNGCRTGGLPGPRYIAIDCRPGFIRGDGFIDFCQGCFLELKTKTGEKYEKYLAENKADGLTEDSIYLRVLFNHGYYQY